MGSVQDGLTIPAGPYSKVLILGAIAAASAFVVTIVTVLLCLGCQRQRRSKNVPLDEERRQIVDVDLLRQTKLRSISKSDTRLHEMNRLACNGNRSSKNRPASMDLLYLPSRRSISDLRGAPYRQMPRAPSVCGQEREHTYSEVGLGTAPPGCVIDTLYESVGDKAGNMDMADTAPPGPVTVEYASIRKLRKVDKNSCRVNGTETETGTQPGPSPQYPLSHGTTRRSQEPFIIPSFPKVWIAFEFLPPVDTGESLETVFMGNGEQYIWKPPDDEDDTVHPLEPSSGNGHDPAVEISEMYSKVCKPYKKKQPITSSSTTEESKDHSVPPLFLGSEENVMVSVEDQLWDGQEVQDSEPFYDPVAESTWSSGPEEADPAYETIDAHWKRDKTPNSSTLQTQRKKPPPAASRAPPAENFYESISEVKQASSTTTTIFTFKDGMEMYVTGL